MKGNVGSKMVKENPGCMWSEQGDFLTAETFEELSSEISQAKQINIRRRWNEFSVSSKFVNGKQTEKSVRM